MHFSSNAQPWTIRPAGAADRRTIQRLSALDSQAVPSGPVLIAEVGDEPWAAVEMRSGRTVADPFRPSAAIAAIARMAALAHA
jgi:hypothetical protein